MKHIIISAIILSSCLSATAQETLSLSECRSKALQYNKNISLAKIKHEQSEYDVKAYRANFFPKINIIATDLYSTGTGDLTIKGGHLPIYNLNLPSGTYIPNVTPNPDGSYTLNQYADFPTQNMKMKIKNFFLGGVTLEEPIYMGGKVTAAYTMSKLGRDIASHNIRLTESEVIVSTDEAYIMAVKAKELGKVAESYKALLEELLKNVESAVRHGMKTNNDKLKVQVKLNEAELNLQRAENAYRLARMNLCHVIGMPLDYENKFVVESMLIDESAFNTSGTAFSPADTLGRSIANRPEYSMLEGKTELAKQQIKLTKSDFLPNVVLAGGVNYANGMELAGRKLLDGTSASVMVSVKIPVFNFGEGANKIRSAKAKYQAAKIEQEDTNEKMSLELAQCTNNLEEAQTELSMTRKSLEQAKENMKMSKQQYEVGFETLSDYLEAQSLWQQAYANDIEANCQLFLAKTKYLKASGQLDTLTQQAR